MSQLIVSVGLEEFTVRSGKGLRSAHQGVSRPAVDVIGLRIGRDDIVSPSLFPPQHQPRICAPCLSPD
jgi:hypothetical protein